MADLQYEEVRVTTFTNRRDLAARRPFTRSSIRTMWIREDCRGTRLHGILQGHPVSPVSSPFVTWTIVDGTNTLATYSDDIETARTMHDLKILDLVNEKSFGIQDQNGVVHCRAEIEFRDYRNPKFYREEE